MSGRLIPSLSVELMSKIAERVAPGAIDRLLALWAQHGPMTPRIHLDVPTLTHQFHEHELAALAKIHDGWEYLKTRLADREMAVDKAIEELMADTQSEDPK